MSIAIIGAGQVGVALASAFSAKGEKIVFGVENVAKYAHLSDSIPGAEVTSLANAIATQPVVILAIPYAAAAGVASSVADWAGKILIDATNPLLPGLAGLAVGTSSSGAEEIAKLALGARVVKAFNTTGAENMANSDYASGAAIMPLCGDDTAAREKVAALASLIGFEPIDFGDLKAARLLEPMAMAWIHLAIKRGLGRAFAFAVMKR